MALCRKLPARRPHSWLRLHVPGGPVVLGRELARLVDGYMEPGYHQTIWHGQGTYGRSVPSGIYITRLSIIPPTAGVALEFSKPIKMLLSRRMRGCC